MVTAVVMAVSAFLCASAQSEMRIGGTAADSIGTAAAFTASTAFAEAPAAVFPTIDRLTRLDMLDYFNSGSDKPSKNVMAGDSRVLALSDSQISVQTSGVQTVELSLLPQKADTLLLVVTTVRTPVPDSSVELFTSSWKPVNRDFFKTPVLADWVLPEGKAQMEALEDIYPFTLASASFNTDTQVLTLTNNLGDYLPEIESKGLEKLLLPSMEYRWDGKRFKRLHR